VYAAGGIGVSRTSQTVERVHERSSHHIDLAVDGAFLYGTSTGGGDFRANVYGGGASFGLKSLWGDDFRGIHPADRRFRVRDDRRRRRVLNGSCRP